ncbi:MAG: branched-chain amino acid ABC transporter substrate-binding protein [Desulfobacteraceae bacterium]|nr:MAG: branched-chain amino acid ABC transporter substrate-binding protein [Desulfobacteraceae bacterium]
MKKRLAVIMIALVSILFCISPAMAKTLTIGTMSPLTGPYAADGNDIANGAKTAVAIIEAEGGIPGYDKIEVVSQDTACDPRQAVAAANKLVNLGVVGVVGAYCSSSTIPASEVLNEEDIPMITPASTNEKVTERGLPYMFRVCGRDDDQSIAAGKFIKNYLKAKTVYIVDDKTTYSQGLAENVAKQCEKLGVSVVSHDHVNQGDKDFSAVLTKIKRANPDMLYMSLQNSSSGSLMAIQAKRFGLKCAILAQDAVYHPQFINIAKEAAQGVYFTFGYVDKTKPSYQKYYEKYKALFGEPGAYSAYAYDSAYVLLTAIKQAKSTDPAKIKAEIMGMNIQGASKPIKFFENGDSTANYIIQVVKGEEFVPFWNPETGTLY